MWAQCLARMTASQTLSVWEWEAVTYLWARRLVLRSKRQG